MIVRSNIVAEPLSLSTCKLIVCVPMFNGFVTKSMCSEKFIVPVLDELAEFLETVLISLLSTTILVCNEAGAAIDIEAEN